MTRAHAEFDPQAFGVRLVVEAFEGREYSQFLTLGENRTVKNEPAVTVADDLWMHLTEPVARAIYEALGKHFVGTSDAIALRADYLSERKRVDKFIEHLTSRGGL